jgi:hypothetical protein
VRFTYEVRLYRRGKELAARQVEVEAGRTTSLRFEVDAVVVNFGVDEHRLNRRGPQTGADALPDPTRRRLTIIGSDADRQRANTELAGPLHPLAADYVVRDYPPDHWAVTHPGFVTSGSPTIYGQEPDGRVLFRQDDLSDLRRNLETVRKPSPDYQPDRDPDFRKTPVLPGALLDWLPIACLALAGWLLWHSGK